MPHPAASGSDGGRSARRATAGRVRAAADLCRPRPGRGARCGLDLRRDDGGLRRSDRGRCDTPADRVGNHGPAPDARLTSEQMSTTEDAMSNPLKKTMVYLGLADEEEVYEEPAPQPRGRRPEGAVEKSAPVTPIHRPTVVRQPAPSTISEILTVHPK